MRLESFSLYSSNPPSHIPNSIRTIHEVINTGVDLYNQYFSLGGNTADFSKTKLHEALEVQQRQYEESGNLSHLSSLVNMIKKGPQFDTFIQFHQVVSS